MSELEGGSLSSPSRPAPAQAGWKVEADGSMSTSSSMKRSESEQRLYQLEGGGDGGGGGGWEPVSPRTGNTGAGPHTLVSAAQATATANAPRPPHNLASRNFAPSRKLERVDSGIASNSWLADATGHRQRTVGIVTPKNFPPRRAPQTSAQSLTHIQESDEPGDDKRPLLADAQPTAIGDDVCSYSITEDPSPQASEPGIWETQEAVEVPAEGKV
jgi:hypothetical protein